MLKIFPSKGSWIKYLGLYSLLTAPLATEGYFESTPSQFSSDLAISHTEGKGLGYSKGYTSLDLFLASPLCGDQIIPFIDARGHVFNNNRWASNLGVGVRLSRCPNQIWGINFFYDALETSHLYYHQVSLGLEALSDTWDLRINGYLPVGGRRRTNIYTLSYDFSEGFLAKAREQFVMGGVDAEIGYHFCNMSCTNLYAGIGPYYYSGRSRRTENAFKATRKELFGGRVRAIAEFGRYFELEAIASYDSHFHWAGQATLSLNVPFDWFYSSGQHCEDRMVASQRVIRNEIIVIDRINRFSSNPEILDPEFEP